MYIVIYVIYIYIYIRIIYNMEYIYIWNIWNIWIYPLVISYIAIEKLP